MAVEASLGVEGALVGNLQLVHGIVVDGLGLFRLCGNGSCQYTIGQPHEDTVEPHLVGVDGLVPVDLVGNGARLVFQLLHHCLHGQQVLGLRPLLVHACDEVSCADVIEVVVQYVVATDAALRVNHGVGVFLAVLADVLATIF